MPAAQAARTLLTSRNMTIRPAGDRTMSATHRWVALDGCSPCWPDYLARCGGGFFHSPPGLLAGAPAGRLVAFQLVHDGEIRGVALGVGYRCRLSQGLHLHFPSLPALHPSVSAPEALELLRSRLREMGAADCVFDSYETRWQPALERKEATTARLEYVVSLGQPASNRLAACASQHRRHITRGTRKRFVMRQLSGPAARTTLASVTREASERAASRGAGFSSDMPPLAGAAGSVADQWGGGVFSAWSGDELLAAALIGWGNRRAFYVMGGSTPQGYASGAATWLHWSIMEHLAEHGFTAYNLGGTPVGAPDAGDPAHGLFRFKTGFGARIWRCRGARFTLRPAHRRAHEVAHWLGSLAGREGRSDGRAA
jgi:hypothetical protein